MNLILFCLFFFCNHLYVNITTLLAVMVHFVKNGSEDNYNHSYNVYGQHPCHCRQSPLRPSLHALWPGLFSKYFLIFYHILPSSTSMPNCEITVRQLTFIYICSLQSVLCPFLDCLFPDMLLTIHSQTARFLVLNIKLPVPESSIIRLD